MRGRARLRASWTRAQIAAFGSAASAGVGRGGRRGRSSRPRPSSAVNHGAAVGLAARRVASRLGAARRRRSARASAAPPRRPGRSARPRRLALADVPASRRVAARRRPVAVPSPAPTSGLARHDPLGEGRQERQRPERRQADHLASSARRRSRRGDEVARAGRRSRRAARARWTTRSTKPCSNRNSRALEAGRQLLGDRAGRDAGAGEADERVRLGEVDVAEDRVRGEHAAGRRVAQDR